MHNKEDFDVEIVQLKMFNKSRKKDHYDSTACKKVVDPFPVTCAKVSTTRINNGMSL
jgi:hypothetical protein